MSLLFMAHFSQSCLHLFDFLLAFSVQFRRFLADVPAAAIK
jgi:hypothetical protein